MSQQIADKNLFIKEIQNGSGQMDRALMSRVVETQALVSLMCAQRDEKLRHSLILVSAPSNVR